jgi:hypothetical protein
VALKRNLTLGSKTIVYTAVKNVTGGAKKPIVETIPAPLLLVRVI